MLFNEASTNVKRIQKEKCVLQYCNALNYNYVKSPICYLFVSTFGAQSYADPCFYCEHLWYSCPPKHHTKDCMCVLVTCLRQLLIFVLVESREKLCGLDEEIEAVVCCAERYISTTAIKYWATSVLWESPQDLSKACMSLNLLCGILQQTAGYFSFYLINKSTSQQRFSGWCSSSFCGTPGYAVQAVCSVQLSSSHSKQAIQHKCCANKQVWE